MNTKDSNCVYEALLKRFEIMKYPMSIYSDDDGAFEAKVNELFDGEGITHIITLTHANIVERFIRTIKQGINERIQFNQGVWTAMLKHVIKIHIYIYIYKYNTFINNIYPKRSTQRYKHSRC